ncbi:MAG: hypothetical protein IPJ13_00395 [Saprospiraceae bacterium]|nr:hypothetical protein [Saprospiraceae bacterium]
MAGETTPSLVLEQAGHFKITVQCGSCVRDRDLVFTQCGTAGTNDPLSGQVKIFPKSYQWRTFLLDVEFKNSTQELKIYNSAGVDR